ncbi:hypothetical protein [Rhodoplanes sp. SY1]|uniref:hypothetical protein n=1 Tax=Rhodoplanes sp. SY1 TaxID=3166646 RepID=UPI0038B5BBAD
MTRKTLALAALVAATLTSAQSIVNAAPYGDQGSRYVETGHGAVETGSDQAKGGIR